MADAIQGSYAYIAVGANLGDKLQQMQAASKAIAALPQTSLLACSRVYETAPIGNVEQGNFYNGCFQITTQLSALALLRSLQTIELELGRSRDIHWGPRTIDLDLLLYGEQCWASKTLHLPHPQMHLRRFVLEPLAELVDDCKIGSTTLVAALAQCSDQSVHALAGASLWS